MKLASHFNRVLITGISGFTGIHLENYLLNLGYDVYGTVLGEPSKANHYQCNITKKEQISAIISLVEPHYVIHVAAISFVAESNASLIYDVNVVGTENILSSLVEHKIVVQRVIISSSALIYGNLGKEVLDESMQPKPVNHYGCSKLSMEHIAEEYFDKLPITITRTFNYTGVGQAVHFLVPKIIKHFQDRCKVIELGNTNVAREFNDVKYVTECYYKLMQTTTPSTIVNLSSNNPIKLMELIDKMNKIAGYEIEIKINPDFVRANEILSLSGSTEKLKSIIGEVEQVALEDTLLTMYNHKL
jgi:nucleoside-diphosphate-sugar epimerase